MERGEKRGQMWQEWWVGVTSGAGTKGLSQERVPRCGIGWQGILLFSNSANHTPKNLNKRLLYILEPCFWEIKTLKLSKLEWVWEGKKELPQVMKYKWDAVGLTHLSQQMTETITTRNPHTCPGGSLDSHHCVGLGRFGVKPLNICALIVTPKKLEILGKTQARDTWAEARLQL